MRLLGYPKSQRVCLRIRFFKSFPKNQSKRWMKSSKNNRRKLTWIKKYKVPWKISLRKWGFIYIVKTQLICRVFISQKLSLNLNSYIVLLFFCILSFPNLISLKKFMNKQRYLKWWLRLLALVCRGIKIRNTR